MSEHHVIVYPEGVDGPPVHLTGTGYATRCARHIAYENIPDAMWALEVLNRYGHLVPHPGGPHPQPTNQKARP